MRFVDAIRENPATQVFRVLRPHGVEPETWQLEPLNVAVLSETDARVGDWYFVIAALNVLPDGRVVGCFMDMNLPERINDYAFFVEGGALRHGYTHTFEGEIVPAIAIDSLVCMSCFIPEGRHKSESTC